MSYRCLDCGYSFEDGEQSFWTESRGEFWGVSCSENMGGCPRCGGGYEETKKCEICENDFFDDQLTFGVCDDCVNKYNNDIEMCYKIGEKELDPVEINCFLASIFSRKQIEGILMRELRKIHKNKQVNCAPFIDFSRDWFVAKLLEEVK